MPAQGRKNVHGKTGVRFKAAYTKSKYENMLRNVVTDLIIHGSIKVTTAVSKDVIKEADRLVTLTKNEDVMNAKRQAARFVRNIIADEKTNLTALDKLFAEIGPKMKDRNGGYTKQFKLENRRGDNAPIVLVTWVD
ncbi:MAG: 50S ribosomal protein L17 [Erysipelotrichaceae bacterium]|jgi:large subunit ribosomal protein L17|nr:50S ribosomal protein L17 [Erysipelotrichaceae bacterium]